MGQSLSCLSLYYVYYNIDIYNLSLLLLAYPFLSSTPLFYFSSLLYAHWNISISLTDIRQTYQRPKSAGTPPSAFGHSTRNLYTPSSTTSSGSRRGSHDRGIFVLSPSKESGNKNALFGSDHRYTLGPGSYNVQDSLMKKSFNVRASTSRKSNLSLRGSPQKPSTPPSALITQSVCSSPTGTYVSIFPLSQNRREVKKPDSLGVRTGYWSGPTSPGPGPGPGPTAPLLSTPNSKRFYLGIKSTATSSQSAPCSQLPSPTRPVRSANVCVVAVATTPTATPSASALSVDDTDLHLHCDNNSVDQYEVNDNAHDDEHYHLSLTPAPAAVDNEINCEEST